MPKTKKTTTKKNIDQQRRSKLEHFGKAAVAIAGMSLIPTLATSAVSFKKGASGSSTLWLADTGYVGIGTTSPTTNLSVAKAVTATETQMTAVSSNAIAIEMTYVADNYLPGLTWYTTNNSPTLPKLGIWGRETGTGTYLYLGTSNSYATGITNHVTIDPSGYLTAARVYGAVWNDIADYLEVDQDIEVEFGKVYVRTNTGETRLSVRPCEKGIIGIASDTYGMSVGKKGKGKKELPIALAGIVLAHCDREYESGTPLTSGRDGGLTKMYWWELLFKPQSLVATFYKTEPQKKWNGVIVNGRHWVKVKA